MEEHLMRCEDRARPIFLLCLTFLIAGPPTAGQWPCGNGVVDDHEDCDDGTRNSDSVPNACRVDCSFPQCGDGVVDDAYGEECDDGDGKNHDRVANACREDCRLPRCGDGVVDDREECDDGPGGESNPYDGCWRCEACWVPRDGMVVSDDVRLCPGRHEVRDAASDGVLQVNGNDVFVDCRGAVLVGRGSGTGIVVSGDGVILRDCHATGFATGIRLLGRGGGVFGCGACGNGEDLAATAADVHGYRNYCATSHNWRENGVQGCTLTCGAWRQAKAPVGVEEEIDTAAAAPATAVVSAQAARRPAKPATPSRPSSLATAQPQLRAERPASPGCRVSGRIRGRTELVATIAAYDLAGRRWAGRAKPHGDGSYTLPLTPGRYRILPQPGGKLSLQVRPPHRELACTAGSSIKLDFEILGAEEG